MKFAEGDINFKTKKHFLVQEGEQLLTPVISSLGFLL